jgi:hypothetical protein
VYRKGSIKVWSRLDSAEAWFHDYCCVTSVLCKFYIIFTVHFLTNHELRNPLLQWMHSRCRLWAPWRWPCKGWNICRGWRIKKRKKICSSFCWCVICEACCIFACHGFWFLLHWAVVFIVLLFSRKLTSCCITVCVLVIIVCYVSDIFLVELHSCLPTGSTPLQAETCTRNYCDLVNNYL